MSASWSNPENAMAPPCMRCASTSAPWRVTQAMGVTKRGPADLDKSAVY
jgi:hypothetical protein